MNYEKMTKAELIEALKSLQSVRDQSTDELQCITHELQVHQIELEMQNRDLLEGQRELEISRNRYVDLYNFAPVGYVTLDNAGLIREINLTGAEMLGRGKPQLIGKPFFLFVAEPERQSFQRHLQRYRNTDEKVTTKLRLQGKGGESRVVELSSVMAKRAESDSNISRTSVVDITERVQAETDLQESEAKHRAIVETAVDGIITINENGIVEAFNRAAELMFGYATDEVIGENIKMLMPETYRSEHDDDIANDMRIGEEKIIGIGPQVIGRHKDGTAIPLELSISEVHWDGHQLFTAIVRDITERKWAEARLMQNSKLVALGELAAGIAHEILNPLAGMMNCTQILNARIEADSGNHKYVEMIQSEGQRIVKITRNMLDFSRQHEEIPGVHRLIDIVSRSFALVGWRFDRSEIIRRVEIPNDLPPLKCRGGQLQQVVINLLLNAMDALNIRYPQANPDKIISLSASQIDYQGRQHLRLTIEDHGAGVSPNDFERLFDPFFTTKESGQGTGLGLSISRKIAQDHQGSITVESEQGAWMRFHVTLPLESEEPM